MSLSLDDPALSLQRGLDRLVRRLRRGDPPAQTHRRFLVVQIDGLSLAVFEHAMRSGRMRFVKRLLARHGYRLEPMTAGLPTSTPAFQMAAMYGVRPDIPGFHYYDREAGRDVHFPRRGHAAAVEAAQAAGRRGILAGGSAYGCVFTGGADNNLFSFSRLTAPTGRGVLRAFSALVLVAWVVVKNSLQTILELARAVFRRVPGGGESPQAWRWVTMQLGFSVWIRGFFTLAVSRDLYLGTPAVYVNYLDYDVAAHAFGPRSRQAFRALRHVDRAIRQLCRVVRRVPEHRYDVYVLADHGQAPSIPYRDLAGGERFERWVFAHLLGRETRTPEARRGLAEGMRARGRETTGLFQRFLSHLPQEFLRREDPEAYERDGIRVISGGPYAFLYLLDARTPVNIETLERRLPGLAEKLSRSVGVGYVLARSGNGPVCFREGKRYRLVESEPGPFVGRSDARLVVQYIADVMAMPSAGDLVIYGIDAAPGHVSYIPEVGAHGGPSPEELETFIVHPARVTLPRPVTHPIQLYAHFLRYQEPA
jgi:hypothetical protein